MIVKGRYHATQGQTRHGFQGPLSVHVPVKLAPDEMALVTNKEIMANLQHFTG